MTNRTAASLLALSLVLVPTAAAAPAPVVQTSDLAGLVAEEARAAESRGVDALWARALELRDAERLGAEGELDRVLDDAIRSPANLSAEARLLLCATRLQGDEPDAAKISEALTPLIEAGDPELGRSAAVLLGNRIFKGLPRGRRNDLVDQMLVAAQDAGRPPAYRLEFAKSAYRVGAGSARRKANAVLVQFLDSEDADLRAQGALAMAEATAQPLEGKLRQVLEQLASVPDQRGALAAAFLAIEDERSHRERVVRDLREEYRDQDVDPEMEEFLSVLDLIQSQHLEADRVEYEDLIGAAVDGMLRYMDPHSSLLRPKAYAKFFQDLEAEYSGIGAYVNEDPDTGLFTVVRPIYSGPAYRSGLKTDDKIVRIGDWPTLGQPEDEIIKRLKGPRGTPVELYVWRHGMDTELIDRPTDDMKVTVVRDNIEIPAGTFQMLPGQIGLVELTTFSKASVDQLGAWLQQLLDDGMRGVILDMRRNSGGLLTEARAVADLFLPRGKVVVSTEGRDKRPESLRTRKDPLVPEDMPVVILTSRMTASAAEIVSGALKDHDRAALVGKTTFGKGSVQQLLPILRQREDIWEDTNQNYRWDQGEPITRDWDEDGEVDYAPRVKLTIARYLLPSGRSIHRELDREGNIVSAGGVEPDVEVDFPLIERWRFEEQQRIRRDDPTLREYVEEKFAENSELFGRLAVNDQKNPDLYPDFDRLFVELDTTLPRDDVRRLLREEVRRRVQDEVGREFPWGDYVEDVQVQKAIEVALEKLGEDVDDVTEYGLVFDVPEVASDKNLVSLDGRGEQLRRIRTMLEQASTGGAVLTEDSLKELLQLVDEIEEAKEN